MSNNYRKLSDVSTRSLWEKHRQLITRFIVNNGYSIDDICIDEQAICAIINKVNQRKQYFIYFHALDMSDLKEVALYCFWYIKLHPISINYSKVSDTKIDMLNTINEKFAVFFLISELRALLKSKQLSEKPLEYLSADYIKELVYTFTYRDISKEALIMLVETMAILMGLNPYK